ncbi:MAG: 2-amino-3,7-dideoxy-D-threo-hept-6-ulosonate synthase [Candidatus Aenigmarchaeota archaeon]|nr:2-amino-3,7-dideoxy-D-threo-hept-6-ulosonate synthase [Candidatus Aenigmarchaeota archaeon]MCX8179381.1 2-amino-3,7-dideoxy-D-threo-hept-6-ulosonate synthase [Candidatus Aenigmarchaeota archaeon]
MFNQKKQERLKKILSSNKTLLIAFDHAVEHGPTNYPNIDLHPLRIAKIAVNGGANGLIMHVGAARIVKDYLPKNFALIIKLTARTSLVSDKNQIQALVTTVDEAFKVGADAIAFTIYVGSEMEYHMFEQFSQVKKRCIELNLPIIGFMYPRSPKYKNKYDARAIEYAARVGAEIGCDIVKTYYTGNKTTFERVVKNCFVPLLVAGGPETKTKEEFLKNINDALSAGARGFALGRNIWAREGSVELLKEVKTILSRY